MENCTDADSSGMGRSRAFPSSLLHDFEPSPTPTPVLLPGVDTLNHSPYGVRISWFSDVAERTVRIVMEEDVPAGSSCTPATALTETDATNRPPSIQHLRTQEQRGTLPRVRLRPRLKPIRHRCTQALDPPLPTDPLLDPLLLLSPTHNTPSPRSSLRSTPRRAPRADAPFLGDPRRA